MKYEHGSRYKTPLTFATLLQRARALTRQRDHYDKMLKKNFGSDVHDKMNRRVIEKPAAAAAVKVKPPPATRRRQVHLEEQTGKRAKRSRKAERDSLPMKTTVRQRALHEAVNAFVVKNGFGDVFTVHSRPCDGLLDKDNNLCIYNKEGVKVEDPIAVARVLFKLHLFCSRREEANHRHEENLKDGEAVVSPSSAKQSDKKNVVDEDTNEGDTRSAAGARDQHKIKSCPPSSLR